MFYKIIQESQHFVICMLNFVVFAAHPTHTPFQTLPQFPQGIAAYPRPPQPDIRPHLKHVVLRHPAAQHEAADRFSDSLYLMIEKRIAGWSLQTQANGCLVLFLSLSFCLSLSLSLSLSRSVSFFPNLQQNALIIVVPWRKGARS